jgi:hypothetical protein
MISPTSGASPCLSIPEGSLRAISSPSLDHTQVIISTPSSAGGSLPPELKLNRVKPFVDTLRNDVARAVSAGSWENVDIWTPDVVSIPPLWSAVVNEEVTREMELFAMKRCGPDQRPCRMGRLCQGFTLATLNTDARGFCLPAFELRGVRFTNLCIVCLRLAVTLNLEEGHSHLPFKGFRRFRVTEFRYERDALVFV